tara:strand:- start:5493 stop:5810 length:318 start_codon:yes stop_codon:yes gene_type:complete
MNILPSKLVNAKIEYYLIKNHFFICWKNNINNVHKDFIKGNRKNDNSFNSFKFLRQDIDFIYSQVDCDYRNKAGIYLYFRKNNFDIVNTLMELILDRPPSTKNLD